MPAILICLGTAPAVGALALLPVLAFSIARLAEALSDDMGIRLVLLGTSSLWLACGIAGGSPQAALFATSSNLVGIGRFHGTRIARLRGACPRT